MNKNPHNFYMGLACGLMGGFLLFMFTEELLVLSAFEAGNESGWVYNYQSLIGGIFALFGAIILIYQYRDTNRRKFRAASTLANLAAANIAAYAHSCLEAIKKDEKNIPTIQLNDLEMLSRMNEYGDRTTHATLHDFLHYLQIYNTRFTAYITAEKDENTRAVQKETIIYDTIILYHKCMSFLQETTDSRIESAQKAITEDHLITAARSLYQRLHNGAPIFAEKEFEKIIRTHFNIAKKKKSALFPSY